MNALSRLALVSLLAITAGCTTTTLSAQLSDVDAPQVNAASYKVVGQVEGSGEAFRFLPFIARLFGAGSVAESAKLEAFGEAIYDRDDVDMIIAPKTKETGVGFLGLFKKVTVTVKGKGVQIIDGQQVQGGPTYRGN
jgi:hypothetical protein